MHYCRLFALCRPTALYILKIFITVVHVHDCAFIYMYTVCYKYSVQSCVYNYKYTRNSFRNAWLCCVVGIKKEYKSIIKTKYVLLVVLSHTSSAGIGRLFSVISNVIRFTLFESRKTYCSSLLVILPNNK